MTDDAYAELIDAQDTQACGYVVAVPMHTDKVLLRCVVDGDRPRFFDVDQAEALGRALVTASSEIRDR